VSGAGAVLDGDGERLALEAEHSARVAALAVAMAMQDARKMCRHLEEVAAGSDSALDALVVADSTDAVCTVWRDIEAMASGKIEAIERWIPAD
jgi:hypothetical protein